MPHSVVLISPRKLAFCHLLLAAGAFLGFSGRVRALSVVLLAVGFGGIGAAWSRHSDEVGRWLDIAAIGHRPRRSNVRCAIEHAPFAIAGITLLYRNWTRSCH